MARRSGRTVNERDQRGDTSPGDYATAIVKGGFYGWPWLYIGSHEDPMHKGERPDLMGHVITPDVLFPAHSAPLNLDFLCRASVSRRVSRQHLRDHAWLLLPQPSNHRLQSCASPLKAGATDWRI